MTDQTLYDRDFYAWANEQAALLRAGKFTAADIAHIAEEIEGMGKTEKRELVSRLDVLLLHLLNWQFQPIRRGSLWERTILEQRIRLASHMADNPSLKLAAAGAVAEAYRLAVIGASDETALPKSTFPVVCPWTFEQIMDEDFWPGNEAH
jgi:hypothetical protein